MHTVLLTDPTESDAQTIDQVEQRSNLQVAEDLVRQIIRLPPTLPMLMVVCVHAMQTALYAFLQNDVVDWKVM